MGLPRRNAGRLTANVWPGFVDAMTALLLVLMFVLSIFMIVQFILSETISDQDTELTELGEQVASLAQALGLEQRRAFQLDEEITGLNATLDAARSENTVQAALIASLQDRSAQLETRVASFEEQVASLLTERDTLGTALEAAQDEITRVIDAREALQLALAQARTEIDVGAEAARLDAARREALEALVADLQAEVTQERASLAQTLAALDDRTAEAIALTGSLEQSTMALSEAEAARLAEAAAAEALRTRLADIETSLTQEETARLTEAAAAEALRQRLRDADAELTAMALSLEAERARAEETLTLLAAAETAQGDLTARLALALAAQETAAEGTQTAAARAQDAEAALAQALAALSAAQDDATRLDGERAGLTSDLAAARRALEAAGQGEAAQQDLRAQLEAELAAALSAKAAQDRQTRDLQVQLAAALAAKLAADQAGQTALSAAEQRALLQAQAEDALAKAEGETLAARREATLLNQQVRELRAQLGSLQAILDSARARDTEAKVQLDTLGTELNAALAQVAAEQRRRAELEAAERARLEAEAEQLERYRSEFFGQLRDLLEGQEGVQIVGDRFVFSSEVLFAPGAADLSPEGKGEIAKVAGLLRDLGDKIPANINWVLQVDGHTDNVPLSGTGDFANNWELSQARALSVVLFMINDQGLSPDRLSANGFGEYQPLNPEDTTQARAQNRRIELKFTEK